MGPESFSVCLKRLRNATGLSQPRLAEKAGISVMALRNWEQGRRSRTSARPPSCAGHRHLPGRV